VTTFSIFDGAAWIEPDNPGKPNFLEPAYPPMAKVAPAAAVVFKKTLLVTLCIVHPPFTSNFHVLSIFLNFDPNGVAYQTEGLMVCERFNPIKLPVVGGYAVSHIKQIAKCP
jgi:hypothetical protein